PLREAAAGSGSQHSDLHGCTAAASAAAAAALASPMGDVHGDFHAPSEIERCRCFPFHDAAPKILVESGQGPFDKAPSKDLTLPAPWVDAIFRSAGAGRNRIIMKLTS